MRFALHTSLGFALLFSIMGCSGSSGSGSDAGGDSATPSDSGSTDSGSTDGSAIDSSLADSAAADSATADSATLDATVSDASADSATGDGSVGSTCSAASPCTGGALCVGGPACGDTWTCIISDRACTDDVVPYCGCDGVTFRGSSTCVTQPVAHLGACETGANCNRSAVSCRRLEPMCPDGQVPEVQGTCWTDRCIPIAECACASAAECPLPETYTCHRTSGRCGPHL